MSASPIARQVCSQTQAIPSKRVLIHDAADMPDIYSSTPGGTLYSTTPGGKYLALCENRRIACYVTKVRVILAYRIQGLLRTSRPTVLCCVVYVKRSS